MRQLCATSPEQTLDLFPCSLKWHKPSHCHPSVFMDILKTTHDLFHTLLNQSFNSRLLLHRFGGGDNNFINAYRHCTSFGSSALGKRHNRHQPFKPPKQRLPDETNTTAYPWSPPPDSCMAVACKMTSHKPLAHYRKRYRQ